MDDWNTFSFPFGAFGPIFRGLLLLLVSGRGASFFRPFILCPGESFIFTKITGRRSCQDDSCKTSSNPKVDVLFFFRKKWINCNFKKKIKPRTGGGWTAGNLINPIFFRLQPSPFPTPKVEENPKPQRDDLWSKCWVKPAYKMTCTSPINPNRSHVKPQ